MYYKVEQNRNFCYEVTRSKSGRRASPPLKGPEVNKVGVALN